MIPLRDDNPTRRPAFVTYGLVASLVVTFLWQLSLGPDGNETAIFALGLIPAAVFGVEPLPESLVWLPAPLTVLTSMFLHGGIFHLAGNLLYLWIFGDNIEDRMGHGLFIVFYLICGAAAALAQALPDIGSRVPMIGASGAISGVLGAYAVLYPRARVLVVIPIFILLYTARLPAILVLGVWFAAQLASSAMLASAEAGVAFRAHIGGFVAGVALVGLFVRARRR
jgi:membrane associated rhomboid family serine protease